MFALFRPEKQPIFYPRFLSGRGFIGALVLLDGFSASKFCAAAAAASDALAFARSFESFSIFNAALAVLLNLFFSFAIFKYFLLVFYNPTAADAFLAIVKNRRLSGRNGALRFVENDAGAIIR